eukprot:gene16783-18478_t
MANAKLKVAEFYSGIGGMHMALQVTGLSYEIMAALELNDNANKAYKFNFPDTRLLQRNIEGLSQREMEQFQANTLLMSPPCQPFTRVGNQKASTDSRTSSFLNIINILENMRNPPKYILMENVKGFEVSVTRNQFVAVLEKREYSYQEFLISPKQFGIPNSRLRYYLLAKLKPLEFYFNTSPEPITSIPERQATGCFHPEQDEVLPISKFLEDPSMTDKDLLLTEEILGRLGTVLDIVTPLSTNSCCFTKAYGSYVKGTGSVLTNKTENEIQTAFEEINNMNEEKKGKSLLNLGLRYFSPREIANLMCFPKSFDFPAGITKKQQYKLLGNSINIFVVSELMKNCLLTEYT